MIWEAQSSPTAVSTSDGVKIAFIENSNWGCSTCLGTSRLTVITLPASSSFPSGTIDEPTILPSGHCGGAAPSMCNALFATPTGDTGLTNSFEWLFYNFDGSDVAYV